MSYYPTLDLWGRARTPYAIYCHHGHGLVYLSQPEYDEQREMADHQDQLLWVCPLCGHDAGWNDDNYTDFHMHEGAVHEA